MGVHGSSQSSTKQMGVLTCSKLNWLLRDLCNPMELTTKKPLLQLPN